MIAVDTNIIVRALTGDDAKQTRASERLLADNSVYIPVTVILESEWVLRNAYHFEQQQLSQAFRELFGVPNVVVGEAVAVDIALQWYDEGLDFADAIHMALAQHCEAIYSFDRKFVGRAPQNSSISVRRPG